MLGTRNRLLAGSVAALSLLSTGVAACGSSDGGSATDAGTTPGMDGGVDAGAAPEADGGVDAGASPGSDAGSTPLSDGGAPTADDVRAWVEAYRAAHPGHGGKDWDIHALTPAQVAADPDAARLLSLCGDDQRPVYPLLAWEYGGADHPWISPASSALCYCVYTPVSPSTVHWTYDPAPADHVDADVYVLFPDENPCRDRVGADQVLGCTGDPTNLEILVDIASYHDGADVGLSLAEASTDLWLLLADASRTRVHLYTGL